MTASACGTCRRPLDRHVTSCPHCAGSTTPRHADARGWAASPLLPSADDEYDDSVGSTRPPKRWPRRVLLLAGLLVLGWVAVAGVRRLGGGAAAEPETGTAGSGLCKRLDRERDQASERCRSGAFGACREINGYTVLMLQEGCFSSGPATTQTASNPTPRVEQRPAAASPAPAYTPHFSYGDDDDDRPTARSAEEPAPPTPPERAPVEAATAAVVQTPAPAPMSAAPAEPAFTGTREASLDEASKAEHPAPYPPVAFGHGIQGTVLLSMRVNAKGEPAGVDVVRSSGNGSLDESASRSAYQWRYRPAVQDGVPVEGRVQIPVIFAIEK